MKSHTIVSQQCLRLLLRCPLALGVLVLQRRRQHGRLAAATAVAVHTVRERVGTRVGVIGEGCRRPKHRTLGRSHPGNDGMGAGVSGILREVLIHLYGCGTESVKTTKMAVLHRGGDTFGRLSGPRRNRWAMNVS